MNGEDLALTAHADAFKDGELQKDGLYEIREPQVEEGVWAYVDPYTKPEGLIKTDKELLFDFTLKLAKAIRDKQQREGIRATGASAQSLRPESDGNRGDLYGSAYFEQQELGRRPTINTQRSGKSELLGQIRKWIQAKGLDLNPFAVTNKIHKEGTRLWRNEPGAKPLGIRGLINEALPSFKDELLTAKVEGLRSDMIIGFKNGSNSN
ncbi:hypothetical protein FGB62_679g02 [Gracilaria domingensis]|nr:hypothetical protein FGB62_679g02 [Gracilaria domingensis]